MPSRCTDDDGTPVARLCDTCKALRQQRLTRVRVRRSRPPSQQPGTVTLKPAETFRLRALIAELDAQPAGTQPAAVAGIVRILRGPIETGFEEIVEERRPAQRKSRRT